MKTMKTVILQRKSKTLANWLTSVKGVPSGPLKGLIDVAADNVRLLPAGSARKACKKDRKLLASFEEITLHPIPAALGYSQLLLRKKMSQRERSGIVM